MLNVVKPSSLGPLWLLSEVDEVSPSYSAKLQVLVVPVEGGDFEQPFLYSFIQDRGLLDTMSVLESRQLPYLSNRGDQMTLALPREDGTYEYHRDLLMCQATKDMVGYQDILVVGHVPLIVGTVSALTEEFGEITHA